MEQYSTAIPAAGRALVDARMNCDDILMNMLVANQTGLPPVFINTASVRGAKVIKSLGKDAGLWRRSQHYLDRNYCLNAMPPLFGAMPLKYTSLKYNIDDHLGRPVVSRGVERDSKMECRITGGTCKDDCVTCMQPMR